MAQLSRRFRLMLFIVCGPTTLVRHVGQVWATPFSLATTGGITFVLFSTPYLDVSVQEVSFPTCVGIIHLQCIRLSHSEIRGFNACMQLPSAYRSLPRPSSPIRSKASTIHPYSLSISSLLFVRKQIITLIHFENYLKFNFQYVKELC